MGFIDFATTFFSFAAVVLAGLAYMNARERFRLDLFDKRWPIYESVVEICSIAQAYGGVPIPHGYHGEVDEQQMQMATRLTELLNNNLEGTGFHKHNSLFGPEISKELKLLHQHLTWLKIFSENGGPPEECNRRLLEIADISSKLPKMFEPYTYFGGYKSTLPGPMNRALVGE